MAPHIPLTPFVYRNFQSCRSRNPNHKLSSSSPTKKLHVHSEISQPATPNTNFRTKTGDYTTAPDEQQGEQQHLKALELRLPHHLLSDHSPSEIKCVNMIRSQCSKCFLVNFSRQTKNKSQSNQQSSHQHNNTSSLLQASSNNNLKQQSSNSQAEITQNHQQYSTNYSHQSSSQLQKFLDIKFTSFVIEL